MAVCFIVMKQLRVFCKMRADKITNINTVLYIEDDCASLRIVEDVLHTQSNIILLSAMDGEYGLELANEYLPELILLDIKLPKMNGYEVLEKLKLNPETKNIPTIAFTADAMPNDIERGLKAGFNDYITKPIVLTLFVESVIRVLDEGSNMQTE